VGSTPTGTRAALSVEAEEEAELSDMVLFSFADGFFHDATLAFGREVT
jgi:hypothetical protein